MFDVPLNLGGEKQESVDVDLKIMGLNAFDYMYIFSQLDSFISLDISKTSTGWVKYIDGKKSEGYYEIKSKEDDLVGQRREFREFLINLFDGRVYQYVFIEDTIGSVNYKTSRILIQLNVIADDLMELELLPHSPIVREGNTVWKKNLRLITNYKSEINGEDDKSVIRNCLKLLGYGDGTKEFIREDIYDAHGLAVGCIVRLKMLGTTETKKKKIRTDISKVYKIEQFGDEYEALDRANELNRQIRNLNFHNLSRDLKYNFKKYMTDAQDDTGVFVISIPTNKIGVIALDRDFDLDVETSYLVVYLK